MAVDVQQLMKDIVMCECVFLQFADSINTVDMAQCVF